ncbi:hypothetical protein J2045_003423 [Peteryoungia aggregata LMG 23059]|uniref:Uncharacterized protein n=1 Tax=Peteryoungia aggregata LMG 23059 TaxID=1368425 RepID=A0ABU0GAJ5_9HYPH|nr:hypothetical protein [Peteryoungia aggregata]MDQ0422375.1 hypothetical protein [Peteryoungia aggregata LMG 23059]
MTNPRQEPTTRVNAGGIIHELEPFLLRYRSRKHEIEALQKEVSRGLRFGYLHPVMGSIRFAVDLDRLARVSADGLVSMTVDDVRRYTGLTPMMIDDLIRDMRRGLEKTEARPTPPPPQKDNTPIIARWAVVAVCLAVWLGVSIYFGFKR